MTEHRVVYMDNFGDLPCAGDDYCEFRTSYRCEDCPKGKNEFCVGHGQDHGKVVL